MKQKLAQFHELGEAEGKPFEIIRLDDAIPGIESGPFIVRIVTPRMSEPSNDNVSSMLTNPLWRSTDEETRRAVFALNARAWAADIISEAQAQAVWDS